MREGGRTGGVKEEIGLRGVVGFLKGFFFVEVDGNEVGFGGGKGVEGVERSLMNASIPLRARRALWFWRLREAEVVVDVERGLEMCWEGTGGGGRCRWRGDAVGVGRDA